MNAKIDQWDDLRVFLAVVGEGTLARAADRLDVNTSTVFRRIAALEETIATRLFEKRGRGYVLTQAGEELAAHAQRVADEIHAVERSLAGRETELAGLVRLTTSDTLAHGLIVPALPDFRARYPGVRVELLLADRFFSLGRGEADVALRAGPRPTEADVVAHRLAESQCSLFASRAYLASAGRPRRRSDLRAHDFVGLDERSAGGLFAAQTARLADPDRIVCRCSTLMAVAAAVQAGIGIGIVPRFLFEDSDDVERLCGHEQALDSTLWLIYHRDLRQTARVRAFMDWMVETLPGRIV